MKHERSGLKRRAGSVVLGVCLLLGSIGVSGHVGAQANLASVVIDLSFVNAAGQPATPPSGSATGVAFTFTPVTAGLQSSTMTTQQAGSASSGQAYGSLQTGTYTFEETVPAGATLQSATLSQSNGQQEAIGNGSVITVAPGAAYTITVVDAVSGQSSSGTATLVIAKSLVTATGQQASGSLAGYTFTLSSQAGLAPQTQTTNAAGQASFLNLPAGVYSLAETSSNGTSFSSMTINGVSAQQGQLFQLQAGGTYDVDVTDTVGGASGTVTIQKQLVDRNGNIVTSGDLSGYSFTLTPQGGGTPTTITTQASGQATANLAPGSYTIAEAPSSSGTFVSFVTNNVPITGPFTVGAGQTTTIVATNRITSTSGTTATGTTRTVSLATGCDNVVNTNPDGTSAQAVAQEVTPTTSVDSIWLFDNAAQVFRSAYFAPTPGSSLQPPVDVPTLNRLAPIFICVTTPATLLEPSA